MGECGKCCKALWAVSRLENLYKNARPFTIKTIYNSVDVIQK